MNEPEILEAYRGVSTPVSVPPDVLQRVEQRIRRRRRARRCLVAVAAVAVAGGVGVQVLGGDAGSGGTTAADRPAGADTSSLTFTRTDGSTYTFAAEDIGITCTPAAGGSGQMVVLARNEMITPTGEFPNGEKPAGPVLFVEVQVDKVEPGQVFRLPYDSRNGASDQRSMTFFFTDGVDDDANELSSAEPGSSGTVTVNEASCGANPTLSVDIAGTVGSEVEQPALAIGGGYRS